MVQFKETEKGFALNNPLYRQIIENTADAIIVTKAFPLDGPEGPEILFVNSAFEDITGYSREEVIGKTPRILQGPETKPETLHKIKKALKNNEPVEAEMTNYRKDGEKFYSWMAIHPVQSESGEEQYFFCIKRDITEQKYYASLDNLEKRILKKNAEGGNLKELLNEYLLGIEKIHKGMWGSILEVRDGKIFNLSAPSLPENFSNAIEGLEIGPKVGSCGTAAYFNEPVIVPDITQDERWLPYLEITRRNNLRACWSYPVRNSANEVVATFALYYPQVKSPSKFELNTIERAIWLLQVIFENRRGIEAIKRNRYRFETVINAIDETIWEFDIQENKIYYNEKGGEAFGLQKREYENPLQFLYDNLHPEDRNRVMNKVQEAIEGHYTRFEIQYRYLTSEGTYKHVYDRAYVVKSHNGKPLRIIGAMEDITPFVEKKELESKLREVTLNLATDEQLMSGQNPDHSIKIILEQSANALGVERVSVWKFNGGIYYCLKSYNEGEFNLMAGEELELEKYYPNYFDYIKTHLNLVSEDVESDPRCKELLDDYFRPHNVKAIIEQPIIMAGSLDYVICFEQLGQTKNWPDAAIGFAHDIGEMLAQVFANAEIRQKEVELQRSLQEKETLLKEIHDRVKNNLAVVSAMLQMQAFNEGDPALKEKLLDSMFRIRAMADIHELLYQTENFAHLDTSEAIKKLAHNIVDSMQTQAQIDLHFNIQANHHLSLQQAIPLMQILNEVFTNTIKHAFNGHEKGRVDVELFGDGGGLKIKIKDYGEGLPEGFNPEQSSTTGMQLINLLTEQLGAQYHYSNIEKGAQFELVL